MQAPLLNLRDAKIAVIGLGYVGLPLAVEFAQKFPTVGFDINAQRVKELNAGTDRTLEVEDAYLQSVVVKKHQPKGLVIADQTDTLADFNVFVVTVPTPTDKNNRPVLTPLIKASESVGKVLKKGDIVITNRQFTLALRKTNASQCWKLFLA